ncbi:MAG: MarR family winged helix-turn-helix transcriptional regulator [Thermoleophilia bacterium]
MSHHAERLALAVPLVRHLLAHLGAQSTPTGKSLGLTNTRVMALGAALHAHGPAADGLAMSDLAAALDLPAPLATRTVDELVERGLLERTGDPSDRRRVLVRPTPEGIRAFEDLHHESEKVMAEVLGRMTTEEGDALVVGLEALLRVMHEPGGILPRHDHP